MLESESPVVVEGELRLAEPIPVRLGATVAAELVDVTLPDLPVLVGSRRVEYRPRGPMPFRLVLAGKTFKPDHVYVLGGRIAFRSRSIGFSVHARRFEPGRGGKVETVWLSRVCGSPHPGGGDPAGRLHAEFTPSYRLLGARALWQKAAMPRLVELEK